MESIIRPNPSGTTLVAIPVINPFTPRCLPLVTGDRDTESEAAQGWRLPPSQDKPASRPTTSKGPARLQLFNPPPLPVSIHLIRDGKIGFDDLQVRDLKTGPLRGRGELATLDAQERMIDHLINCDIGHCRGRRCVDISRVVRSYYGGPAGVTIALESAPQAERQAAARFMGLASNSPRLDLQYQPVALLNRGVQALGAVAMHFDQAVEKAGAAVGAMKAAGMDRQLDHGTAWAYAHGRLHDHLRESQAGLDGSGEMRARFFQQLTDLLEGGSVSVEELLAMIEQALRSQAPKTGQDTLPDGDAPMIETKSGPRIAESVNPLSHRFLTTGHPGHDVGQEDDADAQDASRAPVTQHGDVDWLTLSHHTRPLLQAQDAGAKGK